MLILNLLIKRHDKGENTTNKLAFEDMNVYEIIGGTATSLRMEGEHRIINASSVFYLLKTTSISSLFPQNPCTIQINALALQQHTYPASRKNSALRVSLFFYGHDR